MLSAQRLDDNPCRPRHFKPPPCAPVVADAAAFEHLDATRTRLMMAISLFVLIFLVIAGRLVEVVEMGGTVEPRVARARLVAPPPRVRADIVDRNGTLLATNLDSPSLYVNSKLMLQAGEDPDKAARAITTALPDLSPTELARQALIRPQLRLSQALADPAPGIRGQQPRHSRHRVQPRGTARLSARRPRVACGRLLRRRQYRPGRDRARPQPDDKGRRRAGRPGARRAGAIRPQGRAAAGHQPVQRARRRRHHHGRQHRRDHRDGLAAGFRPEPPARDRPETRRPTTRTASSTSSLRASTSSGRCSRSSTPRWRSTAAPPT